MSMAGLPLKNPTGFKVNPADSTGMTGKSSGRTMWVNPKQCHRTGSLPDLTDRSCTSRQVHSFAFGTRMFLHKFDEYDAVLVGYGDS